MPVVRRYSVKGRLFEGQIIVGYNMQAPDGSRLDVDIPTAVTMARQDMINHVKVANGRLIGDGIRLDRLNKVQV